ncbi:MAG: PQQ-dependent sugar dehydrogenase [Dokdonella sp.]
MTRPLLLAGAIAAVIGCGFGALAEAAGDVKDSTSDTEKGQIRVSEVATGLASPWAVAFLPDGRFLVTERPGTLRMVSAEGTLSEPLGGVPKVFAKGQGGLLDVVLSPTFASDSLVYLSYAEASDDGGSPASTAVARGKLSGDALVDVQTIYRQAPKLSTGAHFGSRLVFDDSGFLFITQGDNNERPSAQELDKLQGKLVRLNADGSVPRDNPFVGRDGARAEIWSYGHRNMQGAALHPVTRMLWTSEHGPRGGDEINIPQAGKNYGWPIITYGINYSLMKIPEAEGTTKDGMEQPNHYWKVSPGLSGMAFATADSAWKGNLFLGALATQELIRVELDGNRVVGEERLLKDLKLRIRDVREGPDGDLYVLSENTGKLLRIEPPRN